MINKFEFPETVSIEFYKYCKGEEDPLFYDCQNVRDSRSAADAIVSGILKEYSFVEMRGNQYELIYRGHMDTEVMLKVLADKFKEPLALRA